MSPLFLRSQVAARFGPDDPEHVSILACRDEARALKTFLRRTKAVVPVAAGAMCLHVRYVFGEAG
ncbi:MAG: hypothetical protein HY718_05085 [Planctomycetes bacterium]|nr:hypothetical protein [Planctomycetota bacterium]